MFNYNPYNNNYPMPQYSPIPTPQTQANTLVRVTGIDGAKAYQMSPNSTVALFDSNEDLMYIKTTDGAGFPTIRTFEFSETHENTRKDIQCDYVTKDEFEAFKKEVLAYGKQSVQKSTNNRKPDE